ncbi:hypothetical protein CTAYLR_003401 [Chrysophaeum taylorii]|uniref:Exostosin GT47 domain-containing protein n=1 Tax=Chrysophaeum taylorii TaxID=2483200 RepID=A0AAD7U7K0_9STRA|nr:hypothetical protein CTAYLR_003401 [Chrysophaeum taylorii]
MRIAAALIKAVSSWQVVIAAWDKPDCWFEPSCFALKSGEFGPQRRGGKRPPFNSLSGLIGDTFYGYPMFYVRNHLEGRAKWDARGINLTVYEKFVTLPPRSAASPYLLVFKPTFCGWAKLCPPLVEDLIANRTDIIWVGHDLGGMKLHHPGLVLPGVTIPGELATTIFHAWRFRGKPRYPHKYFLTFRGKCPSKHHAHAWYMNYSVRGELNRLFNIVNKQNYGFEPRPDLPRGVNYTCSSRQKGRFSADEIRHFYYDGLDSDFALVPRGDERWTFRFLEAVGAGAIPVIVADGLTLPYENLVDWENIVVRVPEKWVLNMTHWSQFLQLLPRGNDRRVRYEALRRVNAQYFADGDTIVRSFDLSVTRYITTGQRFRWKNRAVDPNYDYYDRYPLSLAPAPRRHRRYYQKPANKMVLVRCCPWWWLASLWRFVAAAWVFSDWLVPHWWKPNCWEAECFALRKGEFGPQVVGPRRPPFNRADTIIGDTVWGYPAFYVRNHLEGRDKWDVRGLNLSVYEKFATLPARSPLSPYLLFFKPTFCGWERLCPPLVEHLIQNRTDIVWIGHDLGGMKLHHPGYTLPGITIPGELGSTVYHAWRYEGTPRYPHKHYLTFQGKCSSKHHAVQWYMNYSVRGQLNRLFNKVNKQNFGFEPRDGLPPSVTYACTRRQKGRFSAKEIQRKYDDILDTDYALVPRGDERWSFRFLQAVGAGAVPVVVADGLTLPLEHLIDWENIVVRIPEKKVLKMRDFRDFLPLLPGRAELKLRYAAIKMVHARYFADPETTVWAFDLALTRYIEMGLRFKWHNKALDPPEIEEPDLELDDDDDDDDEHLLALASNATFLNNNSNNTARLTSTGNMTFNATTTAMHSRLMHPPPTPGVVPPRAIASSTRDDQQHLQKFENNSG